MTWNIYIDEYKYIFFEKIKKSVEIYNKNNNKKMITSAESLNFFLFEWIIIVSLFYLFYFNITMI